MEENKKVETLKERLKVLEEAARKRVASADNKISYNERLNELHENAKESIRKLDEPNEAIEIMNELEQENAESQENARISMAAREQVIAKREEAKEAKIAKRTLKYKRFKPFIKGSVIALALVGIYCLADQIVKYQTSTQRDINKIYDEIYNHTDGPIVNGNKVENFYEHHCEIDGSSSKEEGIIELCERNGLSDLEDAAAELYRINWNYDGSGKNEYTGPYDVKVIQRDGHNVLYIDLNEIHENHLQKESDSKSMNK